VDAETPDSPTIERITCLNVPLDILFPEQIPAVINQMILKGGEQHIVLLSLRDLLRARKAGEYRNYVLSAALVIPISKSIIGGVRFLTGKTLQRYMPFDFVIRLLSTLEERGRTVYLLGGRRKSIQTTERNLKRTFPGLRVVGRCAGGFRHTDEANIFQAIKKAGPALLLVNRGVPGDERWIGRNSGAFGPGIRLWCSDLFDVFAERRHRPSKGVFDRGLEWIGFLAKNPLRIFRIFPYLYYKILLVYHRLFRGW